jgi:hypothetical protein
LYRWSRWQWTGIMIRFSTTMEVGASHQILMHQNPLQGFLRHRFVDPSPPEVLLWVGLRLDLRICVSNKLTAEAEAISLRTTLWEPLAFAVLVTVIIRWACVDFSVNPHFMLDTFELCHLLLFRCSSYIQRRSTGTWLYLQWQGRPLSTVSIQG